jgi:hypothetical protein
MTPEERRKEVEFAVKLAEQGILVEPAYDREEWRAQTDAGKLTPLTDSKPRRRGSAPRKTSSRRTA